MGIIVYTNKNGKPMPPPQQMLADRLPQELFGGIPLEMKLLRQWVLWRYVERGGKKTKQPINSFTGMPASTADPSTWATFDEAVAAMKRLGVDGIGFVFTEDDPYFGLDVDGCDDKAFLKIAQHFLTAYVEPSISATGYHIIGKAVLPINEPERTGRTTTHVPGMKKLEIYRHGRFFVMTGIAFSKVTEIGDCQAGIDWLFQKYFPPTSTVTTACAASALSDDQVLQLAKKRNGKTFKKLWAGDTSDYDGDDSRADSALAWIIAFFTRDPAQIRRIMKQSGLIRAKWDERRPGGDWLDTVINEAIEKAPHSKHTTERPRYERREDGMYKNELVRDLEWVAIQLCNFSVQLVGVETIVGGLDETGEPIFALLIRYQGREATIRVPKRDLATSTWPLQHVAPIFPNAYIFPRMAEALLAAIFETSPEEQIAKCAVYGRIGWFEANGKSIYVTRSGAIGPDGLDESVRVELPESLRHRLPHPSEGDELIADINAVLRLLDFRSHWIMYPLIAAIFGAPVSPPRLTVHLVGQCGSGKSVIACLAMCFFGAFTLDTPCATWRATINSILGLNVAAGESVMWVDDAIFDGDCTRMTNTFGDAIGAVGNGRDKDRCDRTGKLRPSPPILCLLISTGEGTIAIESRIARLIMLNVGRDDLDAEKLSAARTNSLAGTYARVMAAFIQWCADKLTELRQSIAEEIATYERLEAEHHGDRHARYGRNTGWLVGSFKLFTRFAYESGAFDEAMRDQYNDYAAQTIQQVIDQQSSEETLARPHQLFLDALRDSLLTGRARIDGMEEREPKVMAKALGWSNPQRVSDNLVGWVDADTLYLLPNAARAAAVAAAPNDGRGIPETIGLGIALKQANLLLIAADDRELAKKIRLPGYGRPRVWKLKLSSLVDDDGSRTAPEF